MATVAQLLDIADAEVGYTERPTNRTKYGAWYGLDGQPWCAMFVSWCFATAGALELVGRHAYTPTFAQSFKTRGAWGSKPKPGAIVFFDFPDSVDRIQHVGIVEKVNADGSIVTIEGNTSSGESGSQSNGGGVYRRTRRTSIAGYGYPAYGEAPVELDYRTIAVEMRTEADRTALLKAASAYDHLDLGSMLMVDALKGAKADVFLDYAAKHGLACGSVNTARGQSATLALRTKGALDSSTVGTKLAKAKQLGAQIAAL